MPGRNYHKRERTLIGAGECYIALIDSDGNHGLERYLGQTPGASLTTETNEIEVESSDGAVAETILRHVVSRKYTFNLTLGDISHENLQLFTGGDVETQAADVAAETEETYEVEADRWIQLGQTSARPAGHRLGGSATVTIYSGDTEAVAIAGRGGAVATVVYDEAPDAGEIMVERSTGRLYIPRGSNFDGKWISVDYTPTTPETKQVKVGAAKALEGAFRYQETADPPGSAKPLHYYARRCSIRGEGQNDLKSREGPQRLSLVVAVTKPSGDYPLLSIEGVAQPAASS